MFKKYFISFKNLVTTSHAYIENNFSFFWNYFYQKKIYKKLNSLINYSGEINFGKNFLVDGHFYNYGYFYRLQLIRKAIKSYKYNEIGIVWNYNRRKCSSFLKNVGIKNIKKINNEISSDLLYKSELIYSKLSRAEDILDLEFPFGVPSEQFYDYILKKQMLAKVDIHDPNISFYIAEYLNSIRFAEKLIDEFNPEKVFMSHAISVPCTPLCWIAPQKGIQVFTLFGQFGVPRFIKFKKPEDINIGIDSPMPEQLDKLNKNQNEFLYSLGDKYLSERILGRTNDISGNLAFGSSFEDFSDHIKNKNNKQIIAVYSSNWFDCPHAFGMKRFRDFEDWIITTYKAALENTNYIWIFRPHPGEEWYGGVELKDILPEKLPDNIFILPKNFSGNSIMKLADGLVTYHGTGGIEYAACGKPVLVADKGWYHENGFVIYPSSRSDYIDILRSNWTENIEREKISRTAKIFSGLYFCIPQWQKNLIMPDDCYNKELEKMIIDNLEKKDACFNTEIECLRNWIDSDYSGYHTYKMLNEENYSLSNVI